MRTGFFRCTLPAFVCLLLTSASLRGQAQSDTVAMAPATIRESVLERPANVVFPEILEPWQSQSADYVAHYAETKRKRIHDIVRRSRKFFPSIVKTFKQQQIPAELKMLIVLESDCSPNVISWAGAVGYWQFMDQTAIEYGLNIITREEREAEQKEKEAIKKKGIALPPVTAANSKKKPIKKDDRKNLGKSTRAAARYLRNSYRVFDEDILLTVASYNCGIGNVNKARNAAGKADGNFWEIKDCLPAETRNYVLNFIALNVILHNYDAYCNQTLRIKPESMPVAELLAPEETVKPAAEPEPAGKE